MLGTSSAEALWLLIPALPLGLFVAWSDLATMRIPNKVVLATGGAFLIFGFIAFPFDVYIWRVAAIAVFYAIGAAVFAAGLVGGGDAKYTAAIAPYFAASDISLVLILFSAMLLGAFVTHRIFARIPAIRRLTPDWASWEAGKKFPMGLALSGTLIFYLLIALIFG